MWRAQPLLLGIPLPDAPAEGVRRIRVGLRGDDSGVTMNPPCAPRVLPCGLAFAAYDSRVPQHLLLFSRLLLAAAAGQNGLVEFADDDAEICHRAAPRAQAH